MSNPRHSRVFSSTSLPIVQGRIEDFQTPPDTEQLPTIPEARLQIRNLFPIEIKLADFLFHFETLKKQIHSIGLILAQHIKDEQNLVNSVNNNPNNIKIRRIEVRQQVIDLFTLLYPYTTNINTENWQEEDNKKLKFIIEYADFLIAFNQKYLSNS
jgi:hypothetical protein